MNPSVQLDWEHGLTLDILGLIAGGRDELKGMRLACKTWLEGYDIGVSRIKISGTDAPPLPAAPSFAARFPKVLAVDLLEANMQPAGLASLQGARKLDSLTVGYTWGDFDSDGALHVLRRTISSDDLGILEGLPIRVLSLGWCQELNPEELGGLQGLKQLTKLHLGGVGMTKAGVAFLRKMPLEALCIDRGNVSNKGLKFLKGKPLQVLGLECCKINDGGLEFLRGMPLIDLGLGGCKKLTGTGFEVFRGMPIAKLDLGWCSKLADEGLKFLKGLSITDLDLAKCPLLTEEGFQHLRGLPLTALELEDCKGVNDVTLTFLRGMPLKRLGLRHCDQVTDQGLGFLRGMPLGTLCLRKCNITDEGLEVLKGMPLKDLNLANCGRLTDAGMVKLADLPLVILDLRGVRLVTDLGLSAFLGITSLELLRLAWNTEWGTTMAELRENGVDCDTNGNLVYRGKFWRR